MTAREPITIDEALADKRLLGAALGDPRTWTTWRAVLRAAFGLRLSDTQRSAFATVAGDREPPARRVDELWCVVGRRGGKTRTASGIAAFIGAIETHRLAAGEIGFVLLLAPSKPQAAIALEYIKGFLQASPVLRQQIESVTDEEIRLKNNIVIGTHANSFRTIRGRTLIAAIFDESAFWRNDESATPDIETYRAVLPALVASGGMLVGISTGYRKLGLLFQKHKEFFGVTNDEVLVVSGSTEAFNPSFDKRRIERAKKADPEGAISEWEGGFRNDISTFLDDGLIDAAIVLDRPSELPPLRRIQYKAFADASGGRHDAYTFCIGHRVGEEFVIDLIRGKSPPFDPQSVTAEYADLAKQYGIRQLQGDNYSAEWVQSAWRTAGIAYERSELPKSALYLEALPHFTRGLVRIPNHPQLTRELRLLERRTSRSGKDTVDHGRNGSDDYANSLVGVLQSLAVRSKWPKYDSSLSWVSNAALAEADARHATLKDFLEANSPASAQIKGGAILMK
jgi:hypothetical protein